MDGPEPQRNTSPTMPDQKSMFSVWWNSLPEADRRAATPESAFRACEEALRDRTRTTELIPAFAWTCDECGIDNFQRVVSRVLDRDDPFDADVLRGMFQVDDVADIPDGAGVTGMSHPTKVTCSRCGTTYRAITPEGGDE